MPSLFSCDGRMYEFHLDAEVQFIETSWYSKSLTQLVNNIIYHQSMMPGLEQYAFKDGKLTNEGNSTLS